MRNNTDNRYGIVYQIYCIPSGKSYVGQTIRTLEKRWRQHQDTRSDCHGVRGAIAKYGADSFTLKVLDTGTDKADLDAKETLWIQRLGTVSPAGYNLTSHGRGPGSPSDETRERQRQAKLAVAQTPEFREAMSLAGKGNKGKKKSPEHVAKVKAATAATRAAHGGSFTKGRPRSPEHTAKIVAAQKVWRERLKAQGLTLPHVVTKTRSDKGSKRPGASENIRAGIAAAKARREAEGTP